MEDMASRPEAAATSGTIASVSAALASVRRQRAALTLQRTLISEHGRRLWPVGKKLQHLRTGQALAGEDAEVTRIAQRHSAQIAALEHDVRGQLLYMHSLLCEELQEHERKTQREVAKCRRRLLVGAARKRLQLLAVFGEEEAGIRLFPQSNVLQTDRSESGYALSRSIAVPMPAIADSDSIHVAMAAVVAERWNVMNPTLEMELATSYEAVVGENGPSTRRTDGYVAVPPECVERFLLVGTLCGTAAADASMAGGPPSQRRVRGQLGRNRQTHCAELVSQAPEIVLCGAPHKCLAACLSEYAFSTTKAGVRNSQRMNAPTVGYAVRCSVALKQCHTPPAIRKGAAVLSGSPEFGSVECLAVSPHELIMFVIEERQLLEQQPQAVAEKHTADSIPADKLHARKASPRQTRTKSKPGGKHVSGNGADGRTGGTKATGPTDGEGRATLALQAPSNMSALQAGITTSALPQCVIVTNLLGESHADDARVWIHGADSGTKDATELSYVSGGAFDAAYSLGGNGSRGGWRVPSTEAMDFESETSRSSEGGTRPLRVTTGRWRQAEARLQQAIRASSVIASSSCALSQDSMEHSSAKQDYH